MKTGQEIVSSPDNSINSPKYATPNSPLHRLCSKLLSLKHSPKRNKSNSDFHFEDSDEIVIQRVFNYFDEDGDGKISPPELQNCVRTVSGEILTKEEAEMAVQSTDSDEDGLLGLEDFSKLIKKREGGVSEEEEELRGAFGMYAAEGTGSITPKSLKRMLSRLGESTSVSKCEVMIRKFDLNGDGVLNFDEFKTMMMMQ